MYFRCSKCQRLKELIKDQELEIQELQSKIKFKEKPRVTGKDSSSPAADINSNHTNNMETVGGENPPFAEKGGELIEPKNTRTISDHDIEKENTGDPMDKPCKQSLVGQGQVM